MLYGTDLCNKSVTLKAAVPMSIRPSQGLFSRWASHGIVVAKRVERDSDVGIGRIIDFNVEPTPLHASLAYKLSKDM